MRTAPRPGVDRAPGLVLVGVGCVVLADLLLFGVAAGYPRVRDVVVWSSLSFAAFTMGMLVIVGARHERGLGLSEFKLGPWSLLWCVVAFGLASLSWRDRQVGSATEIDVSFVPSALAATAAGLAVWVIGYLVGPGQLLVRAGRRGMDLTHRARQPVVRSLATPWLLYAIGLTGRLGTLATRGQLGYVGDASEAVSSATGYGQVLSVLGLFAQFAVAAAAIQVFYERRSGARVTLVVLVVLEIILSGVSGEKQSFITTLLAVLIPLAAARRRLPLVPAVLTALAFVCLIIPFNQAYRAEVRSGQTTLTPVQAIAEAPRILGQALSGGSLAQAVPESVDYLAGRVRNIDSLAIIQQRSPDSVPFLSPVELLSAPVFGVIPRAVWPDKPILATGYQFAQVYYRLPSSVYTSSAITPTGDLYRHGGLVVLLAGMLILGMWVRLVDSVLDIRQNPHAVYFVLLLFPPLVKYEMDYLTLVAGMPVTILAAAVAVFVTFKVRKA